MRIMTEEVMRVATLARLSLAGEEAEAYAREFDSILEHFAVIDEYDLTDEATAVEISGEEASSLRNDVPQLFKDQEKLHQNVKKMKDGLIVVPKILE